MQAHFTACSTPLGQIHVAWTAGGIAYLASRLTTDEAFLTQIRQARRGWLPQRADERNAELTAMLTDWINGQPYTGKLDLGPLTPFARAVLEQTLAIPRGQVRTYGELARAIGKPGAARAVGSALARNPVPLLVPCHRVVPAGGQIGHYSDGGREWKERLLRLEGIAIPDTGAVPLRAGRVADQSQ